MLTVVVPIYNKEKWLERCLDSIINQTYSRFQILLIDDGSIDNSGEICDRYSKKDNRIRVIHKNNEGLVAARKTGAKEANTEYITFVDSDDWIEQNMIERMIAPIIANKGLDLVISGLVMEKGEKQINRSSVLKPGLYDVEEIQKSVVPRMMYQRKEAELGVPGSVCGKIYNRTLFKSIIDRIDNRITYGEDDALVYALIPKCKRILILQECYYHYCIQTDTMATTFSLDAFSKLKILKEHFEKCFKEYGIWLEMREGVNQILWMFIYQALSSVYGIEMSYQFPFDKIPQGSKIVLYGAGAVGKAYYYSLKGCDYASIVAWVDKNRENKIKNGYHVIHPQEIESIQFDYIIICIEAREIALEIKNTLVNELAVDERKIFWEPPKFLMN